MAKVTGSEIGSVTGILGKDDLKNVRNEPDLLLPDFLPTGLENLTFGEVPAGRGGLGCPGGQPGKGSVQVPLVHRSALCRVGFPARGRLKLLRRTEVWEQSCSGQRRGGGTHLRGLLHLLVSLVLHQGS